MININEKRAEKENQKRIARENMGDEVIAAGEHFGMKMRNGTATQEDFIEYLRRVGTVRKEYTDRYGVLETEKK